MYITRPHVSLQFGIDDKKPKRPESPKLPTDITPERESKPEDGLSHLFRKMDMTPKQKPDKIDFTKLQRSDPFANLTPEEKQQMRKLDFNLELALVQLSHNPQAASKLLFVMEVKPAGFSDPVKQALEADGIRIMASISPEMHTAEIDLDKLKRNHPGEDLLKAMSKVLQHDSIVRLQGGQPVYSAKTGHTTS